MLFWFSASGVLTRLGVKSDYMVDLINMLQTNVSTKKKRNIRRANPNAHTIMVTGST